MGILSYVVFIPTEGRNPYSCENAFKVKILTSGAIVVIWIPHFVSG